MRELVVRKVGRKSEAEVGFGILGTGCIIADFHCSGTLDWVKDKLTRKVRDADKIGAATRRNQKGILSGPVAVGLRLSSNLKTSNSETSLEGEEQVYLGEGGRIVGIIRHISIVSIEHRGSNIRGTGLFARFTTR